MRARDPLGIRARACALRPLHTLHPAHTPTATVAVPPLEEEMREEAAYGGEPSGPDPDESEGEAEGGGERPSERPTRAVALVPAAGRRQRLPVPQAKERGFSLWCVRGGAAALQCPRCCARAAHPPPLLGGSADPPPQAHPRFHTTTTINAPPPHTPPRNRSVLRQAIGGDLSRITMPCTINEPLSSLQRVTEEAEHRCVSRAEGCGVMCFLNVL